MSQMTNEEYAYDQSLGDCYHWCIDCGREVVHETPARRNGCETELKCQNCLDEETNPNAQA